LKISQANQRLVQEKSGLLLFKTIGAKVALYRPTNYRQRSGGRELIGACPHTEEHPWGFAVSEKGFYHCFACGAHGGIIRFLYFGILGEKGMSTNASWRFCLNSPDLGKELPRLTDKFIRTYCSGRAE
jgi:hypothetical protein